MLAFRFERPLEDASLGYLTQRAPAPGPFKRTS